MIKKYIKKFIFTENIGMYSDNESLFMGVTGTGDLDGIFYNTISNSFVITDNNNTTQLTISNSGTIHTNGRIESLGNVIYNTNTNRLEFWDGTNWVEINT